MSDFAAAAEVVLQHEGGWVSNPRDPGGETNWGISTSFIRREGLTSAELGVDPDTAGRPGWLKPMPRACAVELYRRCFWDRYAYGCIVDQAVATKVFDASVNIGPRRAHARAQVVVGVSADGLLDPVSFAALNAFEPRAFVASYAAQLAAYYRELVTERPSLAEFLPNWLHRAAWGA